MEIRNVDEKKDIILENALHDDAFDRRYVLIIKKKNV